MKIAYSAVLGAAWRRRALPNQRRGLAPIGADNTQISVAGNGHKRTFPCNGRQLMVEGSDHVIETTGECAGVDVAGANNSVTAAIAPKGKLTVAGTLNKLQWKSTGTPEQDISGIDNKIQPIK